MAFEKVNPSHPDKICDRIGGAIVDLAYKIKDNPKVAVEILLGHGDCHIIIESDVKFKFSDIVSIVNRIGGPLKVDLNLVPQDEHLAKNQEEDIRCGDNGIFCGSPITKEQHDLTIIAKKIYEKYPYDGKYIIDKDKFVICQSNAKTADLGTLYPNAQINPLGDWTGGSDVDSGAINRKLGSDMGRGITGGGLHGKDLSKADVSVNIYAFIKAQEEGREISLSCAIGDKEIDGKPYSEIVKIARDYVNGLGGFEKFAEWGLV